MQSYVSEQETGWAVSKTAAGSSSSSVRVVTVPQATATALAFLNLDEVTQEKSVIEAAVGAGIDNIPSSEKASSLASQT